LATDVEIKYKHKKHPVLQDVIKNKWLYIFLIPGIVFLFIVKYLPIFYNVIAFQDYNVADGLKGIFTSKWIGFANFKYIFFESMDFWQVYKNTIILSVYRLVWGFPAPIILALLLNEVRKMWFKKLAQTLVYLPYFISWVVIAGMVQFMLSASGGAVNEFIKSLGKEPINFIISKDWFRTIIVAITIYKDVGYQSIIYLAALAGINEEQYESASIDGATRLKKIWYITLPGLMPTITVVLILQVGNIIRGGFEQVLLLLTPMVYDVGDIIGTYVYRTGIQEGRFSYSTAIGLFESLIAITLILITNKIAKRYGEGGLW
jgi:putative aldouronate transport system permease protein